VLFREVSGDMSGNAELMPAVILAGGLATRMRPLTEKIPKALLEIEGQPFLWHQLQLLKHNGIRRVVLLVGYLGEMLEERFGDGSALGMRFNTPMTALHCWEQQAQSARRCRRCQGLSSCCTATPTCLAITEVLKRRSSEAVLRALMTVYRNEGLYDVSNVEYDGGRIRRYDKHQRTAGHAPHRLRPRPIRPGSVCDAACK
jgi:hypothetical protein